MFFKLECNYCFEGFRIQDDNLAETEKLLCQNCGNEFPQEQLTFLKISSENLIKAKDMKEVSFKGERVTPFNIYVEE